MNSFSIPAHFDGERIQLDEPVKLEPNSRLIVTVLPKSDSEHESWAGLSAQGLGNAYGDDEEEYTLASIKEPNPEYEGR